VRKRDVNIDAFICKSTAEGKSQDYIKQKVYEIQQWRQAADKAAKEGLPMPPDDDDLPPAA
jgi:hypothetical protein